MKRRIDGREFLRDLATGMSEDLLRKKYDLSTEQLRAARKQFLEVRMRRLKEILDDIQSGMTDSQIIKKFRISPERLTNLRKESRQHRCAEAEGDRTTYTTQNGTTERADLRRALRNFPSVVVSVSEPGVGSPVYQLNDITEAGIGISGIRTQIGDIKTIVVLGDEFGLVAPFEFQAECRWTGTQDPHELPCAGFRIIKISDQDNVFLRDLMVNFTLPWTD